MVADFESQAASIFVCLAASIIEFASTADKCSNSEVWENIKCSDSDYAWALACGVVSTFLCVFGLVLTRTLQNRPAFVDLGIALLLVGLWIFGASFNTRTDGIYAFPGNGYFSTWIALLASANYAYQSLGQFKEKFDRHIPSSGPVLVLVSSIVEMSVAADYYVNQRDAVGASDSGRADWAIACGSLSTFICIIQLIVIFMRLPVAEMSAKVALWAAGAGVNTSAKGPFTSPGNGYFFSWFAFGASIFYAYTALLGSSSSEARYEAPPSSGSEPPVLSAPAVGSGPGYQTLE